MTPRLAALALALAAACAPPPTPIAAEISARGGPFAGVVRESDVDVRVGFPGVWQWRTVFATPDRYAWSLVTNDQPHHYLFDGEVVRAFVGDALVTEDRSPEAPLRSQARFVAVTYLDVGAVPGARVEATRADGGGGRILAVTMPGGAPYTLRFDAADLLRAVAGPVDFAPFARGTLVAELDDYRAVAGRPLPHRIRYVLDGEELAVERVRRTCVLVTGVPAQAFAAPAALPACPRARTP